MKRLILLTAIVLLPVSAMAGTKPNAAIPANQVGPPELTNLQGRLTDTAGNNVADGNYTMIFRIYDAPTGGNLSWAETSSVAVSGGLFNVNLGSTHALDADIFKGVEPGFLEITVNGEVLSSRMQIVSSPYSQNTARVTGDIQTGPGEIVFSGTGGAPELPGIIFQDTTTGDTIAQFGPAGIVWVQPQPEPPLPETTELSRAGFVFKGHELWSGRGERTIGPGGDVYKLDNVPIASFDGVGGIIFADTGTGDTESVYDHSGLKVIEVPYNPGNISVPHTSNFGVKGAIFVGGGNMPDRPVSSYALDGIVMTDTTGDTTALLERNRLKFLELLGVSLIPGTASYGVNAMVFTDTTEDTTILLSGPSGTLRLQPGPNAATGIEVKDWSTGVTKVEISPQKITLKNDAGTSTPVEIGQHYRDNSIVAWGRVTGAGSLTNEFGVTSVTRNSTGNYTITLDAAASLAGNLITTAAPELDTPPTSAAAARILYVNQLSVSPFNKVDIYITNGSFAATDNDFLFIVTAR